MFFKAAIFDLDGTLLNTLGDLAGALNNSLTKRGLPTATAEEVRMRIGNGIRNLIKRSMPEGTDDATLDELLAEFRAYYKAHLHDVTVPYTGIPALLTTLKGAGVRLAVLSNKFDAEAKEIVEFFFPGMFEVIIGERAGVPRKPDPTSAREVIAALGVDPAEILYIGDSGTDMETAKNAGLTAAGVTWGYRARTVLEETGADLLVDAPLALLPQFGERAIDAIRRNFESHGFSFVYLETGAEAAQYLAKVCAGRLTAFGGSMTLQEIGAYEAVKAVAPVHWHWMGDSKCDAPAVYVSSANALSATGEAVNIDGNCNRVSGTMYGSEEVYLVCGANKLEPDLGSAVYRARNVAAPMNAMRLNRHTPCTKDGKCHDCKSAERICKALTVLLNPSSSVKKTEIVLIGEHFGF